MPFQLNQFGDTAATFWQKTTLMASLAGNPEALPADFEDMLEAYYMNNGLYDAIQEYMDTNNIWTPGMKPLYNPAFRAVEFHVAHLWPGPLKRAFRIETENKKLDQAIQTIWKWSNWEAKKQLAARWFSEFGTLFIKSYIKNGTDGKPQQVRQQVIKPRYVTELEVDASDFITYIRIDARKTRLDAQKKLEIYTRTEVWDKKADLYRLYEHRYGRNTPLGQLGRPSEESPISDYGIDFIPFAHAKFTDIGETRGLGVFTPVLDKIDEANRIATRLHEIAFRFNKPIIGVSAGGTDSTGRPLPAMRLQDKNGSDLEDESSVFANDKSIFALPGNAKMDLMIPNINFRDHLAELTDQMDEIKQDLPELRYYDVREPSGISTETMRMMLGGAVDRVLDARGSAYAAFVRANEMALTLGQVNNIEGFAGLGTYENGDFQHAFAEQEVLPLTKQERATIMKTYGEANVDVLFAMHQAGYTNEEIEKYKRSPEYLAQMNTKAVESGVPVESLLKRAGWTDEELKEYGQQKLAAIALQQEDTIPTVRP